MSNLDLSFRAQSLDNVAPDHMVENNRALDPVHVTERQALAYRISRVSTSGQQVFSEGDNLIFLRGNEFILETPSEQLDSAGRIAPIICYGSVPEEPWESWPSDVTNEQREFAASIGRAISEESASSARRGLEVVLKKKRRRMRQRMLMYAAAAITATIATVVIGYWLVRQQG